MFSPAKLLSVEGSPILEIGNDRPRAKIEYEFRAVCTSAKCCPKLKNKYQINTVGVVKPVGKGVDDCPDCGSALYWERREKEVG